MLLSIEKLKKHLIAENYTAQMSVVSRSSESEKSQTQNITNCMIPFIGNSRKGKTIMT